MKQADLRFIPADARSEEGDSYLYNGDVWTSQISNFKALYALQPDPATANYNQDIIIQHRNFTLQNSIQKVSSRSLARY